MACCAFRPRRRIAAPNRVRTRPHAAAARASSSDEEVFHDAAETFLTAGNAEEALALPPHPAAWDRAREGFLGYLTPKQEEKLASMRAMVTQDLELEKCGPSTQVASALYHRTFLTHWSLCLCYAGGSAPSLRRSISFCCGFCGHAASRSTRHGRC